MGSLKDNDVVVASCERDRAGLSALGYNEKALRMYLYVDPREYHRPPKRVAAATSTLGAPT